MIEPKPYGKSVARVVLEKADDKIWKLIKNEFVNVDAATPEDPAIKASVDELYARLGKDADDKVLELSSAQDQTGIAKWLAQAFQKVAKSDLAIVNSGATKGDWKVGSITREQLLMAVPYNNNLRGFDVSRKVLEKALCQAAMRTRDIIKDEGSELIFSVGELRGAGTAECQLVGITKSQIKIVIDEFLMKNSKRWLGQDFTPISFGFGMNTEQVMNLALGVKSKP